MPCNFRHNKADDGSGPGTDPYRLCRPSSEPEQPLIAELRHSHDFRRFLWVEGIVIDLDDRIGPVTEFEHSTFAAGAEFRPEIQRTTG